MPIFEYRCSRCNTKFEKIVLRDGAGAECPNCRSAETEKLISSFALAGPALKTLPAEPGPCGACGAPRRGMCRE